MSATNFTKPESQARLTAIETFIGSRAKPTTKDVMFYLRMKNTTACNYLRELAALNRIHEVDGPGCSTIWATGPAVKCAAAKKPTPAKRAKPAGDAPVRVRESLKINRRFVKSWTANLVRDPLVTALFGPAQQPTGACA